MAVQLQLTRKADGSVANLIALDNEICAVLGVEPDPVSFLEGWMDSIGFSLACGDTFAQARERWIYTKTDPRCIMRARILDYLETYFDNTSYGCR